MTGDSPEVVVVGSINLDLSVGVDRFPAAGETLHGNHVVWGGGGKGANQAVAAARLGRRVAMIGRVGDDEAGEARRRSLAAEGIDVELVHVVPGKATGLAVIEVDAAGENRIVIIGGANEVVTLDDRSATMVAEAEVVLTQLEIPLATVADLAARPRRGRLILNPAPAPPPGEALMASILTGIDVLVPNRGELATLVGATEARSLDDVIDQVGLIEGDLQAAVVTLGADGAVVVERTGSGSPVVTEIEPIEVDAVDTTAAGDAFCGALADGLCGGESYVEATRRANRVAAITVTRRGAQDSLPTSADVT